MQVGSSNTPRPVTSGADGQLPGGIYCRKCGYDLRGQVSPQRCPECGRGFDPADGKTFLARPPRGARWRWAKRGLILLLAVGVLLGMGWGWLYWGWKNEQVAVAKLRVFEVGYERLGWEGRRGCLESVGFVRERVMGLWLNDRATDADLRYLKNIKRLRQLSLYGTQVTDAGLVHLKDLRPLEALDLTNTQVTDAGLVHVKEVKSLRRLDLVNTRVTDAGLVHLAALRDRFPLELNLRGTRATAAGVEKLRAALPDADIRGP